MPLPIAHSLLGASIVALTYPKKIKHIAIPIGIGAFLANSPDFDFALVFLFGSGKWHRGFSHSILFSIIVLSVMLLATKFNKPKESFALGLAFASHFVLDYITTKVGGGLELFWFFDSGRYGLRWFGLSENPTWMSATELITTIILEILIFTPIFLLAYYFRKNYLQSNKPFEF